MSAAKHTQGPWQVVGPSAKGYLVVQGAKGNGVALVLMDSEGEEADARLIAAAPCLLAALQKALEHCIWPASSISAAEAEARAAIANAKGEGA